MRAVKSLHVPEEILTGFARCRPTWGVPPNLTRFTRTVSLSGAQSLSPLRLPISPQRLNKINFILLYFSLGVKLQLHFAELKALAAIRSLPVLSLERHRIDSKG